MTSLEHFNELPTWGELRRADRIGGYTPRMEYDDWRPIIGHHRDSTCLSESNWDTATKILEDVDADSSFWNVVNFGHFRVGWVEEIMVSPDAPDVVREAAGGDCMRPCKLPRTR